jgi:putative DNA primase/helicase
MGLSSYGHHLMGRSSMGKTTVGAVAASVWGGDGKKPSVETWHSTLNGYELTASKHRDGFVVLDEMHQLNPRAAAHVVYMLSSGHGKVRMNQDIQQVPTPDWSSLTFISTGEIGLAQLVAKEDRVYGGQMVRLIEESADAGKGWGAFEDLHGKASPREIADYLMNASCTYYGTAIRELLRIITEDPNTAERRLRQLCEESRPGFNGGGNGAGGEVLRVGNIFALEAAVGEYAIENGILPWRGGGALTAQLTCFRRWIEHRGSTGALDEETAVRFIRGLIEREYSRFHLLQRDGDTQYMSFRPDDVDAQDAKQAQRQGAIYDRIGYRRRIGSGKRQEFIFLPETFHKICTEAKFIPEFVVQALKARGYLTTEPGHDRVKRTLPDHDKQIRVYAVKSSILETPE